MAYPDVHPSLRSLLGQIGFDAREAEVYLAALTLRSARAADIAKLAKQSRSHTYIMLRQLGERGLVAEVERGKILHFVAAEPEQLLSYIGERKRELDTLETLTAAALPQFKGLTSPLLDTPRVTLLHGIDGMKQVYQQIFSRSFCALFNPEVMYATFGIGIPQIILTKEQKTLKGRDLLVDNEATKRFINENPQTDEYEIRLLPKGVTFSTDAMVFDDVTVLFSYDADHTIIRIENRSVADSFRSWFDVLWKGARTTKKNQ